MSDYAARQALSVEHRANPEPGDYWHECFVPYFVVLAVGARDVLVCRKTKEVDSGHWTWDLGHTVTLSRERFEKAISYETMPDKTAAIVVPGHTWAVECWRETPTESHEYED